MLQALKTVKRIYNFSAGPATLPTSVLEKVQHELLSYQDSGMSLMEMSHRGNVFEEVYEKSIARLRKIAAIPERFDILYMTGGASMQFVLVPLNLCSEQGLAAYVHTGVWAQKAIAQAELQKRKLLIAASSEEKNFSYIPKNIDVPRHTDYLHITSNNTIFGTEYKHFPDPRPAKLIIDMSSNFLSGPIDWQNVGLVYAGAQKNAGVSGLTIVIIDRQYYEREKQSTPSLFRYSTFAKSQSMYNTPPTFQIYVFSLLLAWIEEMGGLEKMAEHNYKKAKLIYDVIDAYPDFYKGHANKEDRSYMNITWNFADDRLQAAFLAGAQERNMHGLKGHRSVGGMRASVYNAMPIEGCQALVDYMEEYYKKTRSA